MRIDHPPTFAEFQHQLIDGDERVRVDVQRAGPEVGDLGTQLSGHHADLRLRQSGIPRDSTSFSIRRVETPQQVAGGNHGGQRPLGTAAPLEQPLREVGS